MAARRTEVSQATKELSTYIADAIRNPLPEEVVERAKIHIVDAFAAMVSGSHLFPGERTIAYISREGGVEEASIIGTQLVTSATNAALANGMFAHADESDDTHSPSFAHPGCGVVPAAFAIAERDGLSGTAFLRSVVLGYDICTRVGIALGPLEMRRMGFGIEIASASFGAAAAVSALLAFTAEQIRHVLSYTAQFAAALGNSPWDIEHIQKALLGGRSAQNGVTAGLMVAAGFTGVEDAFSGPRNYFAVYSPNADVTQLTRGLGSDFEICRGAIKAFTTGGPTIPPLLALEELMHEHDLSEDQIEKIVIRMVPRYVMIVDNNEMPDVCLQHLISMMLVDGEITFQSAHDSSRLGDDRILSIRQRIEVFGDPELEDDAAHRRCVVDVTLKDGRLLTRAMIAVKGSPDNPMNRKDEHRKAKDLIEPVLGSERTAELLERLWELDEIESIGAFRKLVSA